MSLFHLTKIRMTVSIIKEMMAFPLPGEFQEDHPIPKTDGSMPSSGLPLIADGRKSPFAYFPPKSSPPVSAHTSEPLTPNNSAGAVAPTPAKPHHAVIEGYILGYPVEATSYYVCDAGAHVKELDCSKCSRTQCKRAGSPGTLLRGSL